MENSSVFRRGWKTATEGTEVTCSDRHEQRWLEKLRLRR